MLSRVGLRHQHAFAATITPRPAQYCSLLHQGVNVPHLSLLDGGATASPRRRGARLAWRPQLALADLAPTALRYASVCEARCASRVTPRGVGCSQCSMLAGAASLGVAHGYCDGGYAARAVT